MDVTSTLLDKSDNVAGDPSDVVPGEKKFFFSSIGKAHLINVLYGIGYTIQIAMLPYMFVGSMFFGRLADIWGVKKSFYLSLCSSSLMYLMLPACRATWAYYVSFLPSFFMQAFQASSLLVCLKTDSEKRTAAIGYLNLSYGMGIILGSLIAGFMVNFVGPRGNLFIALGSQIAALYVAKTLSEDPKLLKPVNLGEIKIREILRALLYICGTSQMTKRVEQSELGTAIGLNTSIFYAVTIVAPYLAFKAYIALGLGLYWLLCAFICLVITTYIFALDKSTLQIFKEDNDSLETMFSSVKLAL
ncbi:transporter [Plasmodium cynomolgi strain B]|uniref:Transporter n=1 Tax=Plasmodium cynomolgi (strain B) TaxID=1120755 RepID=K6UKK4_PLACD|nr:transporter [Plasmodium cynomolgi strain B]GAB66903.1 transporter [Plasmodium cynomolgi strain B]